MTLADILILLAIMGCCCIAYVWNAICDTHRAAKERDIKRCKECGGSGLDLKDLLK